MLPHSRPKVGLALGSGSARGWSHIGVIRVLQAAGYKPDIICGTSIGALVGAVHAAGHLDWLEAWVRKLDWQGILTLMDFNISGPYSSANPYFSIEKIGSGIGVGFSHINHFNRFAVGAAK